MRKWLTGCMFIALGLAIAATQVKAQSPAPSVQEWDLIIPTGVVEKAAAKPAPRISSLEGKTIVLRWNGKHNGNVVLDHLAQLLSRKFPTAKIIKTYEIDQSINKISGSEAEADRITKVMASSKPDIIIASQAD